MMWLQRSIVVALGSAMHSTSTLWWRSTLNVNSTSSFVLAEMLAKSERASYSLSPPPPPKTMFLVLVPPEPMEIPFFWDPGVGNVLGWEGSDADTSIGCPPQVILGQIWIQIASVLAPRSGVRGASQVGLINAVLFSSIKSSWFTSLAFVLITSILDSTLVRFLRGYRKET